MKSHDERQKDGFDFQCLIHIGAGIVLVVIQLWIWWFFEIELFTGKIALLLDIARSAVQITATVIIANNFFRMMGNE